MKIKAILTEDQQNKIHNNLFLKEISELSLDKDTDSFRINNSKTEYETENEAIESLFEDDHELD